MESVPLTNKIRAVTCLLVILALLFLYFNVLAVLRSHDVDAIQYDAESQTDIEALLRFGKPVIVAFEADYCPTCENYVPYIKELRALYGDKICIKYVDVAANEEIRNVYNIELIPSTIFFTSDGKVYRPGNDLTLDESERYDGDRRYVSETAKIVNGESLDLNGAFEYGQGEHGELIYCKYIGLIDMVQLKQIAADLLEEQ